MLSDQSKIEWTDATWPVTAGCDRVSSGCLHCYAIKEARRMAGNPNPKVGGAYTGMVDRQPNGQLDWTGAIRCLPERLDWPVRWAKPRRIFVANMSDLFHAGVPDDFIARVYAVMALTPRHTYQVLTKRPERMRALLSDRAFVGQVSRACAAIAFVGGGVRRGTEHAWALRLADWPLANVWAGTSCEHQAAADERIPHLLATPAAIRFLSAEPLLGPVDLSRIEWPVHPDIGFRGALRDEGETDDWRYWARRDGGIRWIIAGCESGPGHRPMDTDWARSLRDQCQDAGISFFLKQAMVGGRKVGLPELDGRQWAEMPV